MLVICNGMIRSGSTLQYNIAKGVIESGQAGHIKGFFKAEEYDNMRESLIEWANSNDVFLIKMHDLFPQEFYDQFTPNPNALKILYSYRDIRDVAVSAKKKFGLKGDELIDSLNKAVDYFNEIQKYEKFLLTQKYEKFVEDSYTCAEEITAFLGFYLSNDQLNEISKNTSIESFRNVAKSQSMLRYRLKNSLFKLKFLKPVALKVGIQEGTIHKIRNMLHTYDRNTLLHPDHISDMGGQVGIWKTHLSNDEIQNLNHLFESYLKDNDYN